jgi:hypothetical protein
MGNLRICHTDEAELLQDLLDVLFFDRVRDGLGELEPRDHVQGLADGHRFHHDVLLRDVAREAGQDVQNLLDGLAFGFESRGEKERRE